MYRAYFVDNEALALEEFMNNPLFGQCGFQTVGFSTDPLLAFKEIRKSNPDVVFTDLKMPGMSGVELTKQLRNKGAGCEVVIVSAYGDFQEARRFFKMNGFDYLNKPVDGHELQKLLNQLAGKIAGKLTAQNARDHTPCPELNRVVAYLRKNLGEKHTLESLCKKFEMSRTSICNLFANHLGTTFVACLTRLRMEEAARLLLDKQKSVKEIAALCGYEYFYFCRIFKEYHFCTPTDFREANQ